MPYAPRATLDNPYGPGIVFRTEDVPPPAALYISPQDSIQVLTYTIVPNQALSFSLRLLSPQGDMRTELYQANVGTTLQPDFTLTLPPTEGYIMGAVLFAPYADLGQIFVQVRLASAGVGQNATLCSILMQGYVSSFITICYPPAKIQSFFEGPGHLDTVTQSPAAAAAFTFTVPTFTRWHVRSISGTLTTDATVGNRLVALEIKDSSGDQVALIPAATPPTASQSVSVTWASAFPDQMASNNALVPLPQPCVLPGGYQLVGLGPNVGPADKWGLVTLLREEWVGQ